MEKKRIRAPNFTSKEKEVLLSLAIKYKKTIENKKTDSVSVNDKKQAWFQITEEFNAISPNNYFRATDSLKKYYDNLKEDVRKRAGEERKSLYQTGGGPPPPPHDPQDNLLLDIVNKKIIIGLESPFDCDSLKFNENIVSPNRASDSSNTNVELSNCLEMNTPAETNIEFIYEGEVQKKKDSSEPKKWSKASDLSKPLDRALGSNLSKTYTPKCSKGKFKTVSTASRRRPNTVRMLTSSTLAEKYELLIDKKLSLADGLAKEHELRMQLLRMDVALKKKELLQAGYTDLDISLMEMPEML